MPAFSPDGALIAFFQKSKGPHGDYWVIPTEGGQARRLTFDDSFGGAPAWTPDGRFIVFPSQRAGSLTLWKVPAVGGEPEPISVGTGEDTDPEISRDGRRLIYTNTRNGYMLTLTDPASGRQTELHHSRSDMVNPSFSPQGDKISLLRVRGRRRHTSLHRQRGWQQSTSVNARKSRAERSPAVVCGWVGRLFLPASPHDFLP